MFTKALCLLRFLMTIDLKKRQLWALTNQTKHTISVINTERLLNQSLFSRASHLSHALSDWLIKLFTFLLTDQTICPSENILGGQLPIK